MAFVACMTIPLSVEAYIGPGAGLSAIGTAVAFVLALLLLIVGFVWYPVKRFLRRRRQEQNCEDNEQQG